MGISIAKKRRMIRAALAVALLWPASLWAACSENSINLRGDWGQARFSVEIADSAEERAQGLMFREKMATSAGMLFVYERPQRLSFWMKNTLIELDMLFIDPTGTVRHIHHRAQPHDESPIFGGKGLISVLEINGGLAKRLGITVGSQVQHPAFDVSVAQWPC